jgi:hypothetical protein
MTRILVILPALLAIPAPQESQDAPPVIQVGGQVFASWADYTGSDVFQSLGLRCGSDLVAPALDLLATSDCTASSTTIQPQYDPRGHALYEIPVVVHIIESTGGQGQVSDALVASQIEVLNEDFRAIAGTLGEDGNDARIRFYLAHTDPDGNPTTGITRTVNDTWFADSGNYWDVLNWDPHRYLNIYTNSASGYLGYVPGLPQNGLVGQPHDRVVVIWSAFGRNAPIGPPYDLGRTATHEVGHYFGLYHTFSGGCASASACYTNGDLICDTNPESGPVFGCPASVVTCGVPAPYHNYMDYSDDGCYTEFTPEQVNRMRCTLESWRPDLAQPEFPCGAATAVLRNAGSNPAVYSANPPVLGQSLVLTVTDFTYDSALVVGYSAPTLVTFPGGQVLLANTNSTFLFRKLLSLPFGSATLNVPADTSLCGRTAYSQALLFGGVTPFALSNAMDLTPGL